jgi:hypothetical protein
MSDYLYIFRGSDTQTLSPEAMQTHMQKWMAWMKDLTAKGHFKSGEPLDKQGKVLRGRNKTVTDGPYAEAKDLVGGYLLVQAKDLDQAVELSRGCPIFERDGSVEVRPVMQMRT